MVNLLLFYVLVLLLSGLILMGFWFASRGVSKNLTEKLKVKKDAQLLYLINEFFYKYELNYVNCTQKDVDLFLLELGYGSKFDEISEFVEVRNKCRDFGIELCYQKLESGVIEVNGFKKYDYVFPLYIRKPFIGCFKCYSSFYGTLIYWFAYYIAIRNGVNLDFTSVALLNLPYCLSLIYVVIWFEKNSKK